MQMQNWEDTDTDRREHRGSIALIPQHGYTLTLRFSNTIQYHQPQASTLNLMLIILQKVSLHHLFPIHALPIPHPDWPCNILHRLCFDHLAFLQYLDAPVFAQLPAQLADVVHGVPPLKGVERGELVGGEGTGYFGGAHGFWIRAARKQVLDVAEKDLALLVGKNHSASPEVRV